MHTPTKSTTASKATFLAKTVKDYPLDTWSMVNFHVARYYHLASEKYPFTHPHQLAASAVRRDATLSHRWLRWCCQIPNDKTTNYPPLTSQYAFKTEGEVSFRWRIDHASELNWDWCFLGLKLGVLHDDIMKVYGIDLEDSPWPIGTALEHLSIFLPSRGIPHSEKLWYPPFGCKLCAPTFPSEQGLTWSDQVAVPEPVYPQQTFQKFPKERVDAILDNYSPSNAEGFHSTTGMQRACGRANITIFAWSDPIDL